jgi:hypothetical protein
MERRSSHSKKSTRTLRAYDAVVLLVSKAGAELLSADAPTKDFICDAFSHCK